MAELVTVESKTENLKGLGARHIQVLMLALAMATSKALEDTLSVNVRLCIQAMTSEDKHEHFDWPIDVHFWVVVSFSCGYIVLQIPAGILARIIGDKFVLTLAIVCSSIITLFIPTIAHLAGWQLVCVFRVLQGVSQGLMFPCTHNLIAKWVPDQEKTLICTFVYSCGHIGTILHILLVEAIVTYWGYSVIFYASGVLGLVWSIVYVKIGENSPGESKTISQSEKRYIEEGSYGLVSDKKLKTPWSSIFKSIPFIALIIVHGGQNWGFHTIVYVMPTFMHTILDSEDTWTDLYSALPYISMFIISLPIALCAGYLINKQVLSKTQVRMLFNTLALCGPAVALISLSFMPSNFVHATLLVLFMGINAGHYAGLMMVHIDMAPNFAGLLMGISNFFASLVSIVSAFVSDRILNDYEDDYVWRKIFLTTSVMYIVTNTIFLIFGSCKKQLWNDAPQIEETAETKNENPT